MALDLHDHRGLMFLCTTAALFAQPRRAVCSRMQVAHGAPDRHARPWRIGRANGRSTTCPRGSSAVENRQRSATAAKTAVFRPALGARLYTDFLMSKRQAVLGYGELSGTRTVTRVFLTATRVF